MDLNGARRKNATRETTSTLKAWLNEHKKNPYPTKGEKIMLAIITKMTLTQVSTWFANARRRLKKENKMTWEPRNRVEDEDNNNDDDDHKSTDGKDLLGSAVTEPPGDGVLIKDCYRFEGFGHRLQRGRRQTAPLALSPRHRERMERIPPRQRPRQPRVLRPTTPPCLLTPEIFRLAAANLCLRHLQAADLVAGGHGE
jgi:hypothetical protein